MISKNREELGMSTVDIIVGETKESLRIRNLIDKLGELNVRVPTVWNMDYLPRIIFYCLLFGALACIGILYLYIIVELSISFKSLGIIMGFIMIMILNSIFKKIYYALEKLFSKKSIYNKLYKKTIKKSSNKIGISATEYIWLIEELIEAKEKYNKLTFMKEILIIKDCNVRKAEEEFYKSLSMDINNKECLRNNITKWLNNLKNNRYREINRIDEEYYIL